VTSDARGAPEQHVAAIVSRVRAVSAASAQAARTRSDGLLKPQGSLGVLEETVCRLAAVARSDRPAVPTCPAVVVAAGDHGVHTRGVTSWPQEVTAAMVAAMCDGKAAVNALAEAVGARVVLLDVGVATELPSHPLLRRVRIRPGTDDLAAGPAMSRDEACRALLAGADLTGVLIAEGVDVVVTGDMGLANTTASACLIAALTGCGAADATGRGAGIDDVTFERKRAVVAEALTRHRPSREDPLGALAAVGGLEHAALVGVMLAAAAEAVPVILDGIATNAAALVAAALCPDVVGYLVAGHRSVEPGAAIALDDLGLRPLLDLELRLGEGTGGLLAVPLVIAAAASHARMATLTEMPDVS
jgi:nicotinate-nucleotide--dimethylbenzimidazole phosphoribosyltransferase